MKACVLAKTDYSPGISGVAIVKGCALIRQHSTLRAVFAFLRQRGDPVPKELQQQIINASFTFLFQLVRTPANDTSTSDVCYLTPPPSPIPNAESFLGLKPSNEIATEIAAGIREPNSPYDEVKVLIEINHEEHRVHVFN